MHNLFPIKVFLNEEQHRYFDNEKKEYVGFGRFSEFFYPAFKKDFIADRVAKSQDVTKEVVLAEWQAKTDNGTRIDKALELKAKGLSLNEDYADIEKLVDEVLLCYNDYHSCYEQAVVYNEHYRIAGSPDKFMLTSGRKDASFEMSDFKAFEDDNIYEHRGWLLSPFEHLPKTKYTKISLQLSYYAFQLEGLLNKRCRRLFIHLINPVTKTHQQIPVPYMRNDIIIALETHREKLLSLVNTQVSYSAF